MGLKYTNFFDNDQYQSPDVKIITCVECSSHLCLSNLIISDSFNGTNGAAYLVENVINIDVDPLLEQSKMRTGEYLTHKFKCHQCKQQLGWYYKKSFKQEESYKEGKYVIEKKFIRFIVNNSSTSHLIEQAIKNKLKRRYSSSSTITSDDEISQRSNSLDDTTSLHSISTTTSNSSVESRGNHDPQSPQKPRYCGYSNHLFGRHYSPLEFRDINSGVFLNRLSLPDKGSDNEAILEDTRHRPE